MLRASTTTLVALPVLALTSLLLGCPSRDPGDCGEDKPCPGRGEVCDLMTATCMQADISIDATEEPAPETFTGLEVPFFRGQICTVHEVMSGAPIPVSLSPCLHPCLSVSSYEFKHFFSCIGSQCEAYATMWVVADSAAEGCPADAFGRFADSMCTYRMDPVEFSISTTLDSGPISGSMRLEVPFLSNEDIAQIAASGSDQALFESLVNQYPQEMSRIPDGRSIQLLPSNPEPAAACNGSENCTCYDVGF